MIRVVKPGRRREPRWTAGLSATVVGMAGPIMEVGR